MQLKAIKKLGADTVTEDDVLLVLVEDRHGNPLAVVCEAVDGMYDVAHVGDHDFQDVLNALGIHKTVIINKVPVPPPRRGDRLISKPGG